MLLECSCGKMYRVRDGATNPPKNCPSCGGPLKVSGGPAAAPPPSAPPPPAVAAVDPRVKELEGRLQGFEREQGAAKAAVELKEKELAEAQASIARLGVDLEKAQAAYKDALKKREDKIQELEAEATKAKGAGAASASAQTMQLLRAKDEALRESEEKVAGLEQELAEARKGSSHVAGELAEIEGKYKAALKAKEEEVDDLHQRLASIEKQFVEAASKAQQGSDPESQRLAAKIMSLEKIIQDGENRYRSLQKQLDAAGPASDDTRSASIEKDQKIAELEAEMAELRNRAPVAAPAAPGASNAKVGEALYLAADLDRSIASVSTALAGLASRVKRLHETLEEGAAGASAEAPPEELPPTEPEAAPDLPAIEEAPIPEEAVPTLEAAVEEPVSEEQLEMGSANQPRVTAEEISLEDAPTPPPETESSPEPQKKGFFGKLFGKKNK